MKYAAALGIALVLNACANLLMKLGMKPIEAAGGLFREGIAGAVTGVLTNRSLMIGLVCFALNAGFYMYALQSDALKISLAYPIMVGGGFALIAVVARVHPALAERLTTGQMIGVAFILLGIVFVAFGSGRARI